MTVRGKRARMWRSFVQWLDQYLAEAGVAGLVQGGVGILGFGAALSALLGYAAVKGAAVVAALLLGLGLSMTLVASRARWRRRCQGHGELVDLYSRALFGPGAPWRLVEWRQTMRLDANGDTRTRIEVHAVSEHVALTFFRLKFGAGWNQPTRYRKGVTVSVRSLEIAGVGGTRCKCHQAWRNDGLLDVVAIFPEPAPLGRRFHIVVDVFWPGRCRPLTVDREPDQFTVKVGPGLDRLEYTVELPSDEQAFCDPVGFDVDEPEFEFFSRNTPSGRSEVCLRAKDIRDERRVGMRLDLK